VGEEPADGGSIIAVRIRGTISARRDVRQTLKLLHLTRNNQAVLVNNGCSFAGMLNEVAAYVTWGETSKDVVSTLISKRGRLSGNKKFTDDYLQRLGYKTMEELAEAVFSCRVEYWKLPKVQPFFRLRPPTKGFRKSIKKAYGAGGELGYRGEKINQLVKRMI
jgi:large subunit ribosomal protein L30